MLIDLSVVDLVEGIMCGKISAESLMEEVYARIDQYNSLKNLQHKERFLKPFQKNLLKKIQNLKQNINILLDHLGF